MIGLFLAMLELIREKLVWAKQSPPSSSIYLRSLTDEPAEKVVRKAILALAEPDVAGSPQTEQRKQPPIPIVEVSTKSKSAVSPLKRREDRVELTKDREQQVVD